MEKFKVEDRICFKKDSNGFPIYSIRQVKINEYNEPIEISEDHLSLKGTNIDEIRVDLGHLKEVVDKPPINLELFNRNQNK